MATDSFKACQASSSVLGIHKQSLRIRSFSLRLQAQAEGIRNQHGISCSSRISALRPSEFIVSIEAPMFLVGVRTSTTSSGGVGGRMIDGIRIQNAQGALPAFFKLKKPNSASSSSSSSTRLKVHKFSFPKASLLFSREFDARVCATAGAGQTFPSQNGGGEKALPAKPDPEAEPGEVVQAQLKALRERDLATVYEFASPANKSHTGPLPRFTQMLEGRAYNMMIGHIDAKILSSMTVSPSRFQQRIVITGANGKNATFSWSLSKQEEGAFDGCWMTDTVRRDD